MQAHQLTPVVAGTTAKGKRDEQNDRCRNHHPVAGASGCPHYQRDPRPRTLLTLEEMSSEEPAAAFAVRSAFRSTRGVENTISLDAVFCARPSLDSLLALLHAASQWSGRLETQVSALPGTTIACPNLFGFDAAALRRLGVRQTGAKFHGFLCYTGSLPEDVQCAQGTNLEIV